MNIRQAFKISVKSILSNKARSVLTMLGIIIGVAAVIILVSVVQGGNQKMKEYYESLGTNKISVYAYKWGSGKDISQDLYDYCMSLDDLVLGVTPNSYYWGTIKYRTNSTSNMMYQPEIYLGSDQYSICSNFKIAEGRDICYLDIKNYNQVVVLGARLKQSLFNYANAVGETVTIGGYPFTVIGVYAEKDPDSDYSMDNMAVVPYSMNRVLNKRTTIEEFTVKAKNADSTTEAITKLTGFLSSKITPENGYYYVQSNNEWIDQSNKENETTSLILGGIAAISLLVGGIGIMNIMLVTVTERTREIGIRKAIGAERRSIIIQFLIESSVICAVGGIFGIIVGLLGTLVAGKLILDTILLPGIPMSAGAFAFSVVLGICFGMYPAIKASGLQPVAALRAE